MRQFSAAHLAALGVLVAGAVVAVVGPRVHPGGWRRWPARLLAAAILAGWAGEYLAEAVQGVWTVRYGLPLQLTDAVSLVAILALLTGGQLAIELLYFWSFSASLQAVLTPDLGSTFPSVYYFTYFTYHVGAILAALLLVFGCRRYPRRRAIWPVYGLTLAWTALAGLGDLVTKGNYMYLHYKPIHRSLLDQMGSWPWYIVTGAVVGLALFALLQWLANVVAERDRGRVSLTVAA